VVTKYGLLFKDYSNNHFLQELLTLITKGIVFLIINILISY